MAEWDKDGNPITPATSGPKEWDAQGNPVSSALAAPKPTATIGARPSGNILQRAGQYAGDVADDIRYGTGATLPGRVLQRAGAKGTTNGEPPAVGEFMASPVLGPLRVAQGGAQVASPRNPGEMKEGAKNLIGGALQTAQMPAAFAGPEVPVNALDRAIPSMARAGENFERVMQGARNIPVNTAESGNVALRAQELAGRGASMPKVARDFLKRASEPGAPPINYEEGRDFASNAGRLSQREAMKANPAMGRQVTMLARALDNANREALPEELKPVYDSAMKEYRQSQQLKTVGKVAGKAALGALGAGGTYELARKALSLR